MGPAGAGKTTVGRALAHRLGVPFVDADDYHSAEAVARMRAGHPLDDAARGPWLDRLHDVLVEHRDPGIVLACSALRAGYRTRLVGDLADVVVLALVVPPEVLADRLASRTGHYAGPSLLASQLEALELDGVVRLDGNRPVDDVVTAALAVLGRE